MPTKRAAAKPAKPKKAEKPKLTAKKPAAKPVAAKASVKPAPAKAPAVVKPSPKVTPMPVAKPAPAASATPVAQAIRKTAPSERIVVTATGVPSSQSGLAASARANPVDGEGDDTDAGSLLAGPRNVTPYIAKRGEQYMNAVQLEHFRNILNGWKRDLMEEVDRTVSHMKDEAANFPDPNDRATQEEEFSLELRTRDRERKLIRKIDEALKRVEDGSYGYCLETGEEIGVKRPRSTAGGHA
jgi:DnaK suppressor protein